jgi:hypothetical protein
MKMFTISSLATVSLSLVVLMAAPSAVHAGDVKLKDGTVWRGDVGARVRVTFVQKGGTESTIEGTVSKTDKGYLVVEIDENGKKTKKTITSFDLKKIEAVVGSDTGATKAAAASTAKSGAKTDAKSDAAKSDAPAATGDKKTIFLLPWDGMVGVGARHDEIEAVGREADKLGPGQTIVIEINSGGGLVMEGDLIDEAMRELRERHRVVSWIKEAISAAAFTALHCNEIYFTRMGTLGSITMFSGGGDAIEGPELEAWLAKCGDVCEETNRSRWIGEAMVSNEPELSYDILEDGSIKWYNTLEGKFDLSDSTTNLTLEAVEAEKCKFSQGTADTRDELVRLMDLDPANVVWSKAGEDIHRRWNTTLDEVRKARLRLQLDLNNPAGSSGEDQLKRRLACVQEIIKWHDRCFVGIMFDQEGGAPPIQPPCNGPQYQPKGGTSIASLREVSKKCWEDILDQLKKQLADMKKRG